MQAKAQTELAQKFRHTQRLYLDRLNDPAVVAKTSARDSVVVLGVLDDKAARIEGTPSSRVEHDVRVIYGASPKFTDDEREYVNAVEVQPGQFASPLALRRVAEVVLARSREFGEATAEPDEIAPPPENGPTTNPS